MANRSSNNNRVSTPAPSRRITPPPPPPPRPAPQPSRPPVSQTPEIRHPQQPQAPQAPHMPPPQVPHVPQQQQPPHPQQPPQAPNHPTGGDDGGADGVGPIDPREGWFKGKLKGTASTILDGLTQRGTEWAGDQIFGPKDPPAAEPGAGEGGGEGGGGASGGPVGRPAPGDGWEDLIPRGPGRDPGYDPDPGFHFDPGRGAGGGGGMWSGPYPVDPGSMPGGLGGMLGASDAYAWAHARVEQAMAHLPPAEHPDRNGLGGMLDEAVEWALEQSGLIEMLEKVTGNLAELNAAAEEWQAQAHAVQSVATELRGGAVPLSEAWAGGASDAFGGHMGEVADALDQTAQGMLETAQIINSAAQECAMAEGMVIQIISEAIEALIVSLAAEAVIAVFTMGIGLIADALITEAEIAVFVARVGRVSAQLAQKLEALLKALKEMGQAVKAVRNLSSVSRALKQVKTVKTAVQGMRELEQGEGMIAKAAQQLDGEASKWANNQFRDLLGIEDDDPVQRGDGTVKGTLKAAGQSAMAVGKEGLKSPVNKEAIKQELLHDVGLANDPAPYRVDESRIATAFG
ncbi:WXG100 family type VII secretion target [Kitasatospora sp. NPDC048407]|uniref:WXG100 family type VII secretion target n=1 Tax=Kitasatospora sp. NPDC048407 TaxID=3364051 RepID=UPI00371B0E2B